MTVAHRLWHLDSLYVLNNLGSTPDASAPVRRPELSIMLCSTMLRAAGLDWYEQGDVWTRVAAHRHQPQEAQVANLATRVERLMGFDTNALTGTDGPLAATVDWVAAYTSAGRDLGHLTATGLLRRGLRDVLAHHVIFAWNRIGLPAATQALLAAAAVTVIFGADPTSSTVGTTACDAGART
jgi:thiopeptide-type bacteriocin biosynthesis protein